ncbi:MAG: hypothetical protein Q7N87_01030 [Candidatus Uhrbacteria bacterium]|nr:hypothetical protein [Candidatus Uhrbacteria bacterium]
MKTKNQLIVIASEVIRSVAISESCGEIATSLADSLLAMTER